MDSGVDTLVEVGPGATLATFAFKVLQKETARVIRSLPGSERERPDLEVVLEGLGRFWPWRKAGWNALHAGAVRRRVSLPTYPFERRRYWLEPTVATLPADLSCPLHRGKPAHHADNPCTRAPRPRWRPEAPRCGANSSPFWKTFPAKFGPPSANTTFLELGFDSLSLGRFVQAVQ